MSLIMVTAVATCNFYTSLSVLAAETVSVKMFATSADLMDANNFSLADSGATKVGRVSFGTRPDVKYLAVGTVNGQTDVTEHTSSAGAISWLIAGKDSNDTTSGAPTNNVILFSEAPIMSANDFDSNSQSLFQTSVNNQTYNYDANTGYGSTAGSVEVYANHWGASSLRSQLQNLIGSYFSSGEKSLMKETTITTYDFKNSTNYTTKDVLYVPMYDLGSMISKEDTTSPILDVGSASDVIVNLLNCGTGGFWARCIPNRSPYNTTPAETAGTMMPILAGGSYPLEMGKVNDTSMAVSGAFKLDLTPVLFASAVPSAQTAVTGGNVAKVSSDNAMDLRLDAKSNDSPFKTSGIGTVSRSSDTSDTLQVSNAAGSTLMVQGVYTDGNNNDVNWSYSKEIDGDNVSLTASDIVASNNSTLSDFSLTDFSNSKVWLERASTESDTAGLIYAVMLGSPVVSQAETGDASTYMLASSWVTMLLASGGWMFEIKNKKSRDRA
jgi:hypothetical protein